MCQLVLLRRFALAAVWTNVRRVVEWTGGLYGKGRNPARVVVPQHLVSMLYSIDRESVTGF